MAAQMKAHTLKQRLCFARQMRSLLKFMRNMSVGVGDFQIFPSTAANVWQDAQRDYWDGFGELIQHDRQGVVYIPSATLMAELPGDTARAKKTELQQRKWFNAVPAQAREDGHVGSAAPPA